MAIRRCRNRSNDLIHGGEEDDGDDDEVNTAFFQVKDFIHKRNFRYVHVKILTTLGKSSGAREIKTIRERVSYIEIHICAYRIQFLRVLE